jgi:cytochrome c-type biogenesis protein CcmH
MILGIVLTLMTLGAAAMVVVPLMRASRTTATRRAHEIEIYRDQLDEVERDVARGMTGKDEADAARAEIGRRMIAATADADGDAADSGNQTPPGRRTRLTAIVTGLCVPVLAGAVYLTHGSPDLPGRPAAEMRDAAKSAHKPPAGNAEQRAEVARLAGALEENPADLEKWVSLGNTLTGMKRYRQAAIAFSQAMQLAPDSAEYASRAGEALAFAAASQVTPGAVAAFREALRRDPGDARAQYYMGLADQQGGRLNAALDRWVALEAASPPDAPWLKFLRPRIARIAGELGIDRNALAAMRERAPKPGTAGAAPGPRGPTREQMQAAQNMTADDRQAMIRNMVDGLAERLKENPDDFAGWLRLGRARTVLGDKVEAKTAYGRAAALRPDDVEVLVSHADAIVNAAEPAPPALNELKPVVDRILARDPEQPRALWLSGALALSSGDHATARKRWTKLLDFVDPNGVRYVELKKQIEALKGK